LQGKIPFKSPIFVLESNEINIDEPSFENTADDSIGAGNGRELLDTLNNETKFTLFHFHKLAAEYNEDSFPSQLKLMPY
jgi:hypothetical protein